MSGEDKSLRKARSRLDRALEGNHLADAVEVLAELRRYEPQNVRWPHKQGDLLRKLGRNAEAVECFEQAVSLYTDQGFIARAVAMAKTVVQLDPARIEILERVDPQAAQQLRAAKRPPRNPMLLLDEPVPVLPPAPVQGAGRPLASLPAKPPPSAAKPGPVRVSKAFDANLSLPPRAQTGANVPAAHGTHARAPQVGGPARPPLPAAGMRPPPTVSRAAPPPVPPQALLVPGDARAAAPRTLTTLDKLSLPPMRGPAHGSSQGTGRSGLEAIYGRALAGVPELTVDVNGPADETRFSSAPPRVSLGAPLAVDSDRAFAARLLASSAAAREAAPLTAADAIDDPLAGFADELALSEAELTVRQAVPFLESARPEPPAPDILASLPLFPLFAELPRAALSRMIAGSQLLELPHDAYVLRKGDYSDALYGIVDGSVNLIVPGQAFELTLAEGDVFGESTLLDDDRAHADVIVMGQLTALRIPRDVLLDGIQAHPPLAGLVLELLTRRLLGNLLQVSPLFQEFDANTKGELARLFEVRRVAAGSMLSVVGKKMDGLYISLTGTLSVNQPGAPERIAPPGSMFGQNTLLTHVPAQVDVIARVDMIVLRLPAARFSRVAMQYPTMLERLADLSTSEVVRVTM
jgi:CRP-like cAMP-binding protein